ncbi:MAG: dolichyl-P-Man:Man(7)GlcNAc(2)-PP-dolichol alpha-1,6-mannosyltransferase [Geoglossum umbratile]|nr:MAG: dolichyl-P-Man:Man(7)GlcNAc(2)-PP-dolichol alpha-1,6-mannosyltransferase [Geoglossum umbratile]
MPALDTLLSLLIPTLILLHLYVAPFTKVEESFNIQAAHDILTYGIPNKNVSVALRNYDHFKFPGPVPRTFVGAVVLAGASRPVISLLGLLGGQRQVAVRAVLGLSNACALLAYRNGVTRAFGRTTGNWYLLIHASQFHLMYYASRTLPNMFAFCLSTLALRNFLPVPSTTSTTSKRHKLSIYLLTITGIVFRSEVAILLATQVGYLLMQRRISLLREVIPAGLAGTIVGLLVTVPVDSFFWQKTPLWPELAGFYFNAINGKSSNWGTSPWWTYFGNAIPRLVMNPVAGQVCLPLAVALKPTRKASLDILIPLSIFVGIYSLLPHKEWRFVIYALPGLTAVAAVGANWVWTRRTKSIVYRFLSLALIASTLASVGVSLGMLAISSLNYPGAEALEKVHRLTLGSKDIVHVHLDAMTCMTGVTRFMQMPPQRLLRYDKTDDERKLMYPSFWDKFDYVLAERPEKVIGAWEVVDQVDGYAGVRLLHPGESRSGEVENGMPRKPTAERGGNGRESNLASLWASLESLARSKITRGWWVEIQMEPKIMILKKQRGSDYAVAGD